MHPLGDGTVRLRHSTAPETDGPGRPSDPPPFAADRHSRPLLAFHDTTEGAARMRPTTSTTAAAQFAAVYALFTASHEVADYWVNGAEAVSTFLRVSVNGWSPILSCARWRSAVSRLSIINASAHSASLGVTSAVRREPSSARCCSRTSNGKPPCRPPLPGGSVRPRMPAEGRLPGHPLPRRPTAR